MCKTFDILPLGVYDAPRKECKTVEKKREWHGETKFTRMVSVRLPLAEWEKLKAYCETNGKAYTDVVRFALRDYLDEPEDDGQEDGGYFLY